MHKLQNKDFVLVNRENSVNRCFGKHYWCGSKKIIKANPRWGGGGKAGAEERPGTTPSFKKSKLIFINIVGPRGSKCS